MLKAFDIPKFRGDLSGKYPEYFLIHNHLSNTKLRYAYPAIQFKVIDSHPAIIGIGDGITILEKVFMEVEELNIGGTNLDINEKSILSKDYEFGQTEEQHEYLFASPWMALNQKNYNRYLFMKRTEQKQLLENILRGNLKSLSKGFGYFIPDFENVVVNTKFQDVFRNFKNNRMLCFEGTFKTNFLIPDYLGIGKQAARGFGMVVKKSNYSLYVM